VNQGNPVTTVMTDNLELLDRKDPLVSKANLELLEPWEYPATQEQLEQEERRGNLEYLVIMLCLFP